MLIEFLIKENLKINYLYHTTNKNSWAKIEKQGLKINSKPNFSQGSLEYMFDIYQCIPIFLSLNPNLYGSSDEDNILLQIDITGFYPVADIPSLADHGAYIELEDHGIWFKRVYDKNNKLINHPFLKYQSIDFDDLLDPDSKECKMAIKLSQTACILHDIPINRIKRIK